MRNVIVTAGVLTFALLFGVTLYSVIVGFASGEVSPAIYAGALPLALKIFGGLVIALGITTAMYTFEAERVLFAIALGLIAIAFAELELIFPVLEAGSMQEFIIAMADLSESISSGYPFDWVVIAVALMSAMGFVIHRANIKIEYDGDQP